MNCRDKDLEVIFSQFGKIVSCNIIRDKDTGDSLGYAFIEFTDRQSCEAAYFKMNNVLIDDRRIKVDFSQSVARLWNQNRRGGAMPKLQSDRPRNVDHRRFVQKGRVAGQLIDLRLKTSMLGGEHQARAVASAMEAASAVAAASTADGYRRDRPRGRDEDRRPFK
jgi:peptidyl-prolyl cis-trans isomerase-like 4